jgi:hypothetical protein
MDTRIAAATTVAITKTSVRKERVALGVRRRRSANVAMGFLDLRVLLTFRLSLAPLDYFKARAGQ